MAQFSPYVIKALTDVITGGVGQGPDMAPPVGIYRSGPNIERFFMDCGLDMRIGASSRLPATMDFLRQIAAQWDADEKIRRVIQKVADPREYPSDPSRAVAVQEHLNAVLAADGLAVTTVNGKAEVVTRGTAGVVVTAFTETVIHTITTAICEDPYASSHLKRTSAALTRKLEQVIDRPIASAAFLASIWRDFRGLNTLLEREYGRLNLLLLKDETEPVDDWLFLKEKGPAESRGP